MVWEAAHGRDLEGFCAEVERQQFVSSLWMPVPGKTGAGGEQRGGSPWPGIYASGALAILGPWPCLVQSGVPTTFSILPAPLEQGLPKPWTLGSVTCVP